MLKLKKNIIIILILLLAFFLRLYGLNWDQNQHLHPDERFLTMVAGDITWPHSVSEYFSADNPLNPYNNDYDFFVYGTFPVYLTKFFSELINFDNFDYNNITLVGRFLSAVVDTGTVFLIYLIGKYIFNKKTGLLAALLYSIFVLPIQLSHFYATDTFMVSFLFLSFYLLLKSKKGKTNLLIASFAGVFFGLAMASKISAIVFLPIFVAVFIHQILKRFGVKKIILCGWLFVIFSFSAWRITDPKSFSTEGLLTFNPQFIANLEQLQSFNDPNSLFPPAVQWITTRPIIFPLNNIVLWGLGLPLGLLAITSILFSLYKIINVVLNKLKNEGLFEIFKLNKTQYYLTVVIVWIIIFFFYQSTQYVKAMRYFIIIFPFLALSISHFLLSLTKNKVILITILIVSAIYPLSFMSIYTQPHSRVSASEWIYENIPPGSTISCEHWDDCLPLTIERKNSRIYNIETLELFHPDSPQKWTKINSQLANVDYLIMSSNRLWGSIPKVPDKYTLTSTFYENLLEERLGFEKVSEFTSYPTVPILGIELIDDNADESFTVYDHPKVIIFKKSS